MYLLVDYNKVSHLINWSHVKRGILNRRSYMEPWTLTLTFVDGEECQYAIDHEQMKGVVGQCL